MGGGRRRTDPLSLDNDYTWDTKLTNDGENNYGYGVLELLEHFLEKKNEYGATTKNLMNVCECVY